MKYTKLRINFVDTKSIIENKNYTDVCRKNSTEPNH